MNQTNSLNKDVLIEIFCFLPLKQSVYSSCISKKFKQALTSEEFYEEIIKIHKIYILKNNRTYISHKEKFYKNIFYDSKDKRTSPKWNSFLKTTNFEKLKKTCELYYYSDVKNFENLCQYLFPKNDDSHVKEILEMTKESLTLHSQILKYSIKPHELLLENLQLNESKMKKTIQNFENLLENFNSEKDIKVTNSNLIFSIFQNEFDTLGTFGYFIYDVSFCIDKFTVNLRYDDLEIFSKYVKEIDHRFVLRDNIVNIKTSYIEFINGKLTFNFYGYLSGFIIRKVHQLGDMNSILYEFVNYLRKNKKKDPEKMKYKSSTLGVEVHLF